jgi:hypothetical protein
MAGVLQHLRSSTLNKRPNPASMVDGQVAINYASGAPGMFFKDSNGSLVKVGPVHVGSGAPNAVPASGGTAGNSLGEQWLDTSGGTYVFKIWDGSAWRSEAGEFVNVTGDTMTGALGIIAGSAGSPSLFISGDANTGLYSPGADQVAISTNGTGRITVQSDGNVLIGATGLANRLLTVNQTGITGGEYGISISQTSATSNALELTIDSANALSKLFQKSTIPLVFGTNDTERMRLDSNGRLGLGTSSPGHAFDCVASSAGVVAARFRGNSSGNNNTQIRFYGANTATDQWAVGNAVATDDATRNFDIYDLVSNVNRLRIDSSGRVGIGTTNPRFAVSIGSTAGAGVVNPDTLDLGGTYSSVAGANAKLRVYWDGTDTFGFGVSPGQLEYTVPSSSSHVFYQGATQSAKIDSSGRLLVGTSSQSGGSLLQVNDNRIRIATAKTPASATDTGVAGEICWDANYVYVCTATNTWKRSAISTW